jgi:tRNA pseudouridine13 synthase
MLPDWPRAFGEPVLTCRLRRQLRDFQVDEQLGFEFDDDGEHDYLKIEKRGANTTWVAERLANFAGVGDVDVGFAGMKDRHAITTQWYSIRRAGAATADWSGFDVDGVRVLQSARHSRKLRRGAHIANRFRIALRDLVDVSSGLEERLSAIRAAGVPNYFGEQRFGRDGSNLDLARRLFAGRRITRGKRSIAISAARSFIFNQILGDRIEDGTWNTLQPGDCANLDGSGSFFATDRVDDELQYRLDTLDIHVTGPLWGSGSPQSGGTIAERELRIARRYPDLVEGLANQRLRHSRRALRLVVRDFSWEGDGDTLWLQFSLARGGYATAVLREIASWGD